MQRRAALRALAALSAAAMPHVGGRAQPAPYPQKPVRWVVPYTAGGITDEVARVFGLQLQETLGQSVVVDNRPGGAGNIGSQAVAKAAPDGYTLLLAAPPLATNPALFGDRLGYDPLRELQPISHLLWNPNAVMVRADSPFRTIDDLFKEARARPGSLSYGSAGIGTMNHLGGEMLKKAAGIDMAYVPYKGSAPVMQDILAGTLPVASDNLATYTPQIRAGKIRALVVLGPSRVAALPDVPSMADAGFPGFDATGWVGASCPAGTPAGIVESLAGELARAARIPQLRQRFEDRGFQVVGGTPAEFSELRQREARKQQALVRELGLKA